MSISFWSILVVILMLGLLVTVHELGHYFVAKMLKIKAYEVSIFVGPKLISWKNKQGVDFSIRAIPFGAYVRFTEIDEEGHPIKKDDDTELLNQPRYKRLLVSLAGPFMNIVLGVLIFIVLYTAFGYTTLEIGTTSEGSQLYGQEYEVGDRIVAVNGRHVFTYMDYFYETDEATSPVDDVTITLKSKKTGEKYDITLKPEIGQKPMIGITTYGTTDNKYGGWQVVEVNEDQNGGKPILKIGDYLLAVNGKSVADPDFSDFMSTIREDEAMILKYVRNGEVHEDECLKKMITYTNSRGVYVLGYKVDSVNSFFKGCLYAVKMPATITNVSIRSLSAVFNGQEEVYNMVSGPVGVTSVVSDVVDNVDDSVGDKAYTVILLCAIISIGLSFTNLLPIPGLDGIQIVLIIVEMILGRKLSEKAENIINAVGLVMLILLVLFALASDVIRIIVGG